MLMCIIACMHVGKEKFAQMAQKLVARSLYVYLKCSAQHKARDPKSGHTVQFSV